MANVLSEIFQNIADAIRGKTGDTATMKPSEFSAKILEIEASDSLTWCFANTEAGSGSGAIALRRISDGSAGIYDIYFADENGDILSPYGIITTIDLTSSTFASNALHYQYAIPKGAKQIVAVKDGVTFASFQIPDEKQIAKEKKFSFGLLSDIHIDGDGDDTAFSITDFDGELTRFENDGMDFCVVSGDVTQSGLTCDIEAFNTVKNAHNIPIYCIRGNHDTYNDCTIEAWNQIEPNGLYYEIQHNDEIFLFVGMTAEDVANPFEEYILQWLETKLNAYANRRVFVIQHVFVEPVGNSEGLYLNLGMLNTEGCTGRYFRDLMKKYQNVVFISGHSHFVFEMQNRNENANISARTEEICHRIHVPSGSRPRNAENNSLITEYDDALGYEVDVYDDFLIIRGIDFTTGELVMLAQYYLNTTPITIEEPEEDPEEDPEDGYPFVVVTELAEFEQGSIDKKTGINEDSSSYRTVGYITLSDNPTPTFQCDGSIVYFRLFYYDANHNYLGYESHYNDDISSGRHDTFTITPLTNAVYIRYKSQGAYDDLLFNGAAQEVIEIIPTPPPIEALPQGTSFPEIDEGEEPEETIPKARWKALNFLKRQMNTSQMKSRIDFETMTVEGCNLIYGTIPSLENPAPIQNKYIYTDSDYAVDYTGIVSGKWYTALEHPENYRVDVYVIADMVYYGDSCDLNEDFTWRTSRELGVGIKHIELVEKNTGIIREYGSPVVDNYAVNLYEYADVEYLIGQCKIFMKNGKYYFFRHGIYEPTDRIFGKVVSLGGSIVGISSNYNNIYYGRLPSSYFVPVVDPNYARDGSSALGEYAYMMNSRSFIYDAALALLVFTQSQDYDICKEILNRVQFEQNEDGSWNFSYDNYVGKLFDDYVRTGAIGWLVWGACYYTLKSGDTSYVDMIKNAGEWLLARQITDSTDARYGLLTGGVGNYDADYVYNNANIEWCSTEHNCSALQGIYGLYAVTQDERYSNCASMIESALINTLYDSKNGRFYQGVNPDGTVDDAWALDCTSWAGKIALSFGRTDVATACANTCISAYGVKGKTIEQSSETEFFNMTYALPDGVTVSGFKPYGSGYNSPPEMVWTEGTLGAIALLKALGRTDEANAYLQDMIALQNCNGSTGGVIYTTKTIASIPYEFHVWESAVSSAWLYLVTNAEDALFCGEYDT